MLTRLVIMHRAVLGAGLIGLCLALACGQALADPLALQIRNNSGMPLESIQISPDYSPRWGGNNLESSVGPGQDRVIRLPNSGVDCYFDVQISDASGQMFQYWGLNLCTRQNIDHR